ncbi:ROK family protein [Aquibacillus sp. 3ASR75-11]|uniref:ROK family protein n=1 Tax=Terrihalobacillus insolitus TaxID=2950438 RepID=A0A9X3WRV0_9BACI|nr:ROK family protein [Terrihalobacillus insolitus]MDC3412180.1 ROK family protein [Terrihalobacillus insolitus]MDC3423126.1 ROK family protein [Terrihalobacillus insolitus]
MYTVGVDIGGTKIRYGLFDARKLVRVEEMKTPKEAITERLIDDLRIFVQGRSIQGIGIASAGIVDFKKRKIKRAANLRAIENVLLGEILEKELQVPVALENDANCAALAEAKKGAARSVDHSICITIGTGIGGGIIHDEEVVHGRNGYAGEVGHMVVVPSGKPCGCGRKGCWEMYASGKALERMIAEDSVLAGGGFTPKDVLERAGCDNCRHVIDRFVEALANGLINLQYIFDPEMIVVGGGVTHSSEAWWDQLEKKVGEANIEVNVQRAHFQNDAGMIGASFLVK